MVRLVVPNESTLETRLSLSTCTLFDSSYSVFAVMSDLHYALRVDLDRVEEEALKTWLGSYGGYFAVKETSEAGSNPHVHALMNLLVPKDIRAVRKNFRTVFPSAVGNAGYSLTKCTGGDAGLRKYEQYMCKGVSRGVLPEILGFQGLEYSESWVRETHERYWSLNLEYCEGSRAYKRTSNRKPTVIQSITAECKKREIKWDQDKEIARVYLEVCSQDMKSVNAAALRSVVEGVKLQLCPDDSAVNYLVEKYYGNPWQA